METTEFSLIVIKPDALERNLSRRIRQELETEGLMVHVIGFIQFDLQLVKDFYRWLEFEHPVAVEGYLCGLSLPVWAVEDVSAVDKALSVKTRLRAELCGGRLKNLFHCSTSQVEFRWEYNVVRTRGVIVTKKTNNQVEVVVFKESPTGGVSFLVLKRNPRKGGFWQPVTGNVELGESFEEAAAREVREELGVESVLELIDTGYSFEFFDDNRQQFERVFGARVWEGQRIKLSPEHTEYMWVSKDEALDSYLKYPGNKEGLVRLWDVLARRTGEKGG